MKCEEAEELISALADNQLSDREQSSIEGHLRECPRCQRAYEWHRSLNSEIRTVSASVVAPDDLRRRILSDQRTMPKEVESSNAGSKLILRLQPFLRPAFASAVLVILVISVLFLMLCRSGQRLMGARFLFGRRQILMNYMIGCVVLWMANSVRWGMISPRWG